MAFKLPFKVPGAQSRVQVGDPDRRIDLDGHEQIETLYLGGPDYTFPPDAEEGDLADADVVTVVARRKIEDGELVPYLYDVTYWRRVADGA